MTPRRQLSPTGSSVSESHSVIHRPVVANHSYDVMSQQDLCDAATRKINLDGASTVPPIRFFTEEEARLLGAVVDRIMPQDDRAPEDRIPVVPWIDHSLYNHVSLGYRVEDMPPQEEAWRLGLQGIDETSRIRHGRSFRDLINDEQDEVLVAVATGKAEGEAWKKVPAKHFWDALLMAQICEQYYSYPTAWNEIGFGGPNGGRDYVTLNYGLSETWEVRGAPR